MIERARLAQLAWGDKQHLAALQKQYPEGFDIILGADVVYVEEFVPQLFKTARALMSEKHEASMMAAFITSDLASTVLHNNFTQVVEIIPSRNGSTAPSSC